jgi:hypothetical protein
LLYLAASHATVSAALVQENQDGQAKRQVLVYFVSEVLSSSKKNYTEMEKVLYAILMASRKLRHYFQSYYIIVPSSQPLKDIIRNRETTGRVGKWVAELNEFTIDYVHRSAIQSQALADFIDDWTLGAQDKMMMKLVQCFVMGHGEPSAQEQLPFSFHHLGSEPAMQQGWNSTAQITLQNMKPSLGASKA